MGNEQEAIQGEDKKIFGQLTGIYQEAAANSLTMIMRTPITVKSPEMSQMELKEVEYMILEPAVLVKSCLTSHVAGTQMLIFRERDIQIFLNKLMGIDELASPDFVFDEVSLSATAEIMNQMSQDATAAVAEYLGNNMKSSDCELTLSDGSGDLSKVMAEEPDSPVVVITHKINIDEMIDSEFIQVMSTTAVESIREEISAKEERDRKDAQETERLKSANVYTAEKDLNITGGGVYPGE